MATGTYRPKKLFTVEEANRTLPLVRAICQDLAELSRDVIDRRERLAQLASRGDTDRDDLYREEVAQIEDELEEDSRRLQEYVGELRGLGVEPKSATEGLVDFPALIDGHLVFLCWKLGEGEVLYWHELDSGFSGRHPLTADSVCDGAGGADEEEM